MTAKRKGAGLLGDPELLERFLDEIFTRCPIRISIKTRIGMNRPEEFPDLLALYNRYPVSELIVHPRIGAEAYRGHPHREWFAYAASHTDIPLVYNGDLFRAADIRQFCDAFPDADTIMLGRGLLADPGLLRKWKGEPAPGKQTIAAFHEALVERYRTVLSGDRNLLFHCKEIWAFLAYLFENHEKYAKKIRKAATMDKYRAAVDALFAEQDLREDSAYGK